MKHLKLFENFNDELYSTIDADNIYNYMDVIIIENRILKIVQHYLNNDFEVDLPLDKEKLYEIVIKHKKYPFEIIIKQFNDEWFVVYFLEEMTLKQTINCKESNPKLNLPWTPIGYKCDGLDGLMLLLSNNGIVENF